MKLKRLQLRGYKTFAIKTEFEFDAGITAVVGPNGSGKSNIADAIRWVLGEQSYSTLRGKRTTDMIFAGSQSRARAGMAQAILTLDNTDNWLPIDYSEVEIGRRAYRSGENEYLLNGQKVRLRDVQDLLATSGLAERTYTIIGQGLIDQALSLRPEERRTLFEEAAGVSHYQARRAETLRRLQETQHNIERVHDILSEIRPRLGTLKRQAGRALTYGQVEADLRHHLRIWYGYQWEQRKKALREQRLVAQEAERAWRFGRDEIADQQKQLAQLRKQIEQLQDVVSAQRAQREELREKRESAHREVAVLTERAGLLQRQLTDTREELARLQGQRDEAQAAVNEAVAGLETARAEFSQNEAQLEQFSLGIRAQQEQIDHWTSAASRLQEERDATQKQLSQSEGQLRELRERLKHQESIEGHGAEVDTLTEQIEPLEGSIAALQEQVTQLHDERRRLHDGVDAARRTQQSALKEQRALHEKLALVKERVARLESRSDLLNQLREQKLVVDGNVQVLGRLASFIEIEAPYRAALEAVLGARLNTLVVEEEASLRELLRHTGAEQSFFAAATAAIHPLQPPANVDGEGVLGRGIDFVAAPDQLRPLVRLLLEPVILVQNIEDAWRIGNVLPLGAMAVTPEGTIVHGGGLAEVKATHGQDSIVAREEAWRSAIYQLEVAQNEASELSEQVAKQQAGIEQHEKELAQLSKEEQQVARQAQEAEQRLNYMQRELDRAGQRRAFLQQQLDSRAAEVQRLRQRLKDLERDAKTQRSAAVRLEAAAGEARMRLEELPVNEVAEQHRARRQDMESARTIVAGRQAVLESRRTTLQQIDSQIRRLDDRRERITQEQTQLSLERAQSLLQHILQQIEEVEAAIAPLVTQRKQLQESYQTLEDEIDSAQRKAHDLETHYTQARVMMTQRENQLDGLTERIHADLGLVALSFDEDQGGQAPLPIDEVVEQLPVVESLPHSIEEAIQELRSQLHRIGSINPDAPEEYEKTQERFEFLTQQIDDLTETEKRLRGVIAELDDLTSRAFAQTVIEVDGIFSQLFERLFGGGSAQLVLTEPDDLTISGVDIVCRLPNRRQQRLGLLSGGERSLTATALIFALLKVAPPPFCVMDEVDAMLDEANINRFRTVLQDLSQNSQFIVITHNRGTVQAARTVYGISMGVDSASQVISLRPEEYVNGEK